MHETNVDNVYVFFRTMLYMFYVRPCDGYAVILSESSTSVTQIILFVKRHNTVYIQYSI